MWLYIGKSEQQRELMRYMNSLNEWLGHDVEDRQAELRGVSARMDQLRDDLDRLGLPRGPCKLYHLYMPRFILHSNLLTFSPAARAWSTTWRFYSGRSCIPVVPAFQELRRQVVPLYRRLLRSRSLSLVNNMVSG